MVRGESPLLYTVRVFAINYPADRVYGTEVDPYGFFTIDSLPPGTYTVYAQAMWFENDTISDVVLESFNRLNLDFYLHCANKGVPYTYSYISDLEWIDLALNQSNVSETANVVFKEPEEVSLETRVVDSSYRGFEYYSRGVITSDILSFQEYPVEANMSWCASTNPYMTSGGARRIIRVEFRVRSVKDDGLALPWSEPFTSPRNIEPFLDGESRMFQYELVLETDDPSATPVVSSMRVNYRCHTEPRLVETVPPSMTPPEVPRF